MGRMYNLMPSTVVAFSIGGITVRRGATRVQTRRERLAKSRSNLIWLLAILIPLLAISVSFIALTYPIVTPSVADPRFAFEASTQFDQKRTTQTLGVQYHVNSAEFSRHPMAAEIARSGQSDGPQSMPALQRFEENVDQAFISRALCQRGLDSKQQRKDQAYADEDLEKVEQIEAEAVESCETLKQMGLLR